jgi:zinc transporter ZupT
MPIAEGMAVFLSSLKTVEYGFILAIAIALHNIPEGIAVCTTQYCQQAHHTEQIVDH